MKNRSLYDFWRKLRQNTQLSQEWEVYQTFLNDNLPIYKPGTVPSRIDPSFPFRKGNIKWITKRRLATYPTEEILQMYKEGHSQKAIGEMFNVAQSTIHRILKDIYYDNKET